MQMPLNFNSLSFNTLRVTRLVLKKLFKFVILAPSVQFHHCKMYPLREEGVEKHASNITA